MQHHHDGGAAAAVEVGAAGRASRPGGRRRGTSWARRAAAGRCPGPAPSRSRPAAAGRRRARRRPGRRGRRCRSAPAPRRRPARPRATSAGTLPGGDAVRGRPGRRRVTPSGAIGFCGSRPRVRATCRVDCWWIASPSSSTAPDAGRSSRAMPRSRVDLPQALGPTIDRDLAVGDADGQLGDDRAFAVPQRDARRRRAAPAPRCGRRIGVDVGRSSRAVMSRSPSGAAAGEQPEQERRPERAGDDADGEVDVGEQVVGDVVARDDDDRARPAPAPSRVVRPPLRARAIGPARNDTKAIGPAAATPTAVSTTASSSSASVRRGRDAQPGRGVLAELGHPQRPRQPDHDRQQHQQEPARAAGSSASRRR